jgi:hypothetical protein
MQVGKKILDHLVTWQFATSEIAHVAHYYASPKGDVLDASHVRNGV